MATNTYQPDATAGKDNWMVGNSTNENSNFGTRTDMGVGASSGKSPSFNSFILEFDISDISAGATVTSAYIDFVVSSVSFGGATYTDGRISRIIRTDWSESQSTWVSYKTSNAWTTKGARSDGNDYSSTDEVTFTSPGVTGAWQCPDITALVQDAIDNRSGILRLVFWRVGSATSAAFNVWTSDYTTAADRPQLTVNYTEPSGAKLLSLLGVGT